MDRVPPSSEAAESPSTRSQDQDRPQDRDEALRRSEEELRLLVDQVTEYAIFRLGPEGHVVSWNAGAERIKGYAEEEILGRHFSTFYTEEALAEDVPEAALERAAREGEWKSEGWRVRKGGSRFWASVTLTALRGEDGELRGFAKVTRDMTERRQREEKLRRREEALRESERRYRRLFEEAQEGIGITTPEGEIVEVNPAAKAIFGYTREELFEMNAADLYVDPEERKQAAALLANEGAVRGLELRGQRKVGREIVVVVSTSARRGPDGEIEAFQTFFRDVTEREQAEEALKESERRFRRLFEESRDAVVLTTPEGAIIDANGAAEALFGYSREELLRLDASELYADRAERERQILPKLMRSTSSRVLEAEMRHKEGHTFLASASVTVHRGAEGEPELIQALVRNITDQRRLQREVLRVQEEERRRLGQDLHDGVASQLTGVAILLGSLAKRSAAEEGSDEDGSLAEAIREARDIVDESCQDVRRLSRGLAPAGLSEGGLASALGRLAENVESGVFEKEVNLPELEGDATAHLYWIAQEATTNARKYAEANEIAIRLVRENGALALEVEDDGVGFDVSGVEEGSLGLRTMRYRTDLLGAALTIDSSPGSGTRVRCRLPM